MIGLILYYVLDGGPHDEQETLIAVHDTTLGDTNDLADYYKVIRCTGGGVG